MPVCEVSMSDLEKLIGRRLDVETIEEALPKLKCEVEGFEGEVVVYEATHDRPDLFSAEGLARALKGLLQIEVGLREFKWREHMIAYNEGPSYRPYVLLATVHGLRLDDEAVKQMMQLQEKLHATYGRGRKKVSIGIYDLSKVEPPIRYVEADPDAVRFRPLDFDEEMSLREILKRHPKGQQYGHLIAGEERYPLLVDSRGTVLSMPPIINSEDTRVTEETRDVLIDVTATDARAGAEVLTVVATSLAERGEWIGLVRVKGRERDYVLELDPRSSELEVSLVERLAGLKVTAEEAAQYLRMMRFGAAPKGAVVSVLIPAYRLDILHPVDLVEEVVMGYGYENLVPEVPPPQHAGREDPMERFSRKLREIAAGLGFQEVNNYMMTNKEVLYTRMNAPELPTVELANPRQETFTCLRTWLIPQLIQVLSRSKHAEYPQRIFECGDVALIDESEDNMVREERRLALAISDAKVTLTDIHAVVDALMRLLGLSYSLASEEHPSFISGRCASIIVEGVKVGIMGEIHPQVLVNWGLEKPVVAAEISLTALMALGRKRAPRQLRGQKL